MEELVRHGTMMLEEGEPTYSLPDITEYGVQVPFRFAVIGQTDSGKTYSIMRRWLGGRISYWTSASGRGVQEVKLRHCLYCNNGNVSLELKQELVDNFVVDDSQRVFHLDRFPTQDDIFNFISGTSNNNIERRRKQKLSGEKIMYSPPPTYYVYAESSRDAPHRVIILDDLMVEAFDKLENRDVMQLLMTKLSHHNNISMLIVCHELYPKGKNAILLRDQLTGVHIHSLANVKKIMSFIRNYLNDKKEEDQYVRLFEEHVSRVGGVDKCNRCGSIIVKFNVPSLKQQHKKAVGRFITFNDRDHAVVHENHHG